MIVQAIKRLKILNSEHCALRKLKEVISKQGITSFNYTIPCEGFLNFFILNSINYLLYGNSYFCENNLVEQHQTTGRANILVWSKRYRRKIYKLSSYTLSYLFRTYFYSKLWPNVCNVRSHTTVQCCFYLRYGNNIFPFYA